MVDTGGIRQQMGSVPVEDPQIHHPDRFSMLPRQAAPEGPRMMQQVSEAERPVRVYNYRHAPPAADVRHPDAPPAVQKELPVQHDMCVPARLAAGAAVVAALVLLLR